jgi:hypothetical protein
MTPALDHRSAARILDLADPADASSGPRKAQAMAATVLLFAISAIAAHAMVAGGSPTAALGADSFSARVGRAHAAATQESSHMNRLMAVAASGAVAMGSSAFAQDAVQWRVEDGGNGHWYQCVRVLSGIDWESARIACIDSGGHLATVHSIEENLFTYAVIGPANSWKTRFGPWLGGIKTASGWSWVTGEPWTYTNWAINEPNNGCSLGEDRLHFINFLAEWNDLYHTGYCDSDGPTWSYIIEYSADCNSDGIVDYGQIRAGELDDVNANNIPDCCEAGTACGCAADISGNGIVDAVDLAAVLSSWGNAPTGKTNADINRDGEINAIDLAEVLSSWGTCP